MGKITGFLEIERTHERYAPVAERLKHYREFAIYPDNPEISEQGARCMDCGIPFCHSGCPVNNMIPDWNDLVWRGDWRLAIDELHATNNFPEFTGRVCPAPCEAACTLNINEEPVAIKSIERAIADNAFGAGWVEPRPAAVKTGKRIAVVGSGPAGMACAQQLARAGHAVEVFEKNEKPGGLLRFGIPDFKMEKSHIDRRVRQMEAEGVVFHVNTEVGGSGMSAEDVAREFDAVVMAVGSEHPRDLTAPGRDLAGVHFAMEYLPQQNRRVAGLPGRGEDILAGGKHVVVIGGGDTGSDCIGTANRQGAEEVVQFELLPRPPHDEDKPLVWPNWPLKLRTSTSHAEGCEREWAVATKSFTGEGGRVEKIVASRLRWKEEGGRKSFEEIPGGEFEIRADLVLLAMGYMHPVHEGAVRDLGLDLDARGNIAAGFGEHQTSRPGVFAAGDARRGQSLVVWAIREGRECATAVDEFLSSEAGLSQRQAAGASGR